jgi:hypothetical protein
VIAIDMTTGTINSSIFQVWLALGQKVAGDIGLTPGTMTLSILRILNAASELRSTRAAHSISADDVPDHRR